MKIEINGVKQVTCIKRCLIQLLEIVLGIVAIVAAIEWLTPLSSYYYLLLVTGGILVVVGVVNFIVKRKIYVSEKSKSPVQHTQLNMNVSSQQDKELLKALKNGEKEFLKNHRNESSNNKLVELIYSENGDFGAFRVSEYRGYNFEVIYPWEQVEQYSVLELASELKKR